MPHPAKTETVPRGLDQPAAFDPAYLERSFDSLVAALDAIPVEAEKDYLARLVLILAEELKDAERFEDAVARAMPPASLQETAGRSQAPPPVSEDVARGVGGARETSE